MKEKKQKNLAIWALVISIFATSVAYAILQTTLSISGSVVKKGGSWNVALQNVHNISNGGTGMFTTSPTVSGTSVSFAGKLLKPNDWISFDVDVVNSGTIDATLSDASLRLNGADVMSSSEFQNSTITSDDITCSLLYNGSIIEDYWVTGPGYSTLDLKASTTKSVTIKCQYNDVSSISSTDSTMNFSASFSYYQA